MTTTMTVAQFPAANTALALVRRDVPEPGAGEVLLRVRACGICHSDRFVQAGAFPGLTLPRIPGHEVAAVVERVGPGVRPWQPGDRVGVGWHGGHDFVCDSCRVGDFITCREAQITGISRDGGYGEHMVARAEALARIPDALGDVDAAPLLCAGITTFNALRNSPARPGDLVAVQGLGGLGHLAVQFAHRMGFRTVAVARGDDKRPLAAELGADEYVDSAKGSAGQALAKMGGARVILATAPSAAAVEDVMGGLGVGGQLLLVAAVPEPLRLPALQLIGLRQSIRGWPSGHAKDSEDTLRFAAATGVRPMVETFPLARAPEAYARMVSGKARFRVVLTMG
jgi:D-arabinose 1-dehydrogenase-like Zn-dependent alcohol dehydrogenase